MGLIRLLLAVSVIAAHAGPIFGNNLVGGTTAVETFFVISGFYMALVLNEKYVPEAGRLTWAGAYQLFAQARHLRLFPMYLIVLAASVLFFALAPATIGDHASPGAYWAHYGHVLSPATLVTLAATNLLLFGQDVVMFLGVSPHTGSLYFTKAFFDEPLPAYRFLYVPQAWSLGIELLFYVLAPLIVRRPWWVAAGLIVASTGVRVVTYKLLGHNDPWTYRFFPSELAFFMLGSLVYRTYEAIRARNAYRAPVAWALFALMVLAIVTHQWFNGPKYSLIYYALVLVSFPMIFLLTKNSAVDRFIGDLSYPVYICHMLVLDALRLRYPQVNPAIAAAAAVALSTFLLVAIDRPVDHMRQVIVSRRIRASGILAETSASAHVGDEPPAVAADAAPL